MNFLDNVRHRLISGFIFVGCAVICCQCSCVQTSHLWEAPTCENAVQNIDDAVFRLVPKRQFLSSANIGCTRHSIVVCRIPDCLPDPCFHGNCMETLEGFSCRCQNDWTGDLCDIEVPTPITEVTNLTTTPEVGLSTLTPRDREETSSQFTMTIDRVVEGSGASKASLVTTAAEATVYRGEVGASVSPQEDLPTTAAVTNDAIDPSTTKSVDGADPGETTTSEAVTSQETSSPPSSPRSTSDVITTTASQKSENCSLDSEVPTPITKVTNLSTKPEVSLSTLTPRGREENSSQFTMTIDRVEAGSGASEASLVTTAAEATVYRGEVGASASPQESSSLATTAAVTNDAIVPSTTESVDGADPGETTTSEAVTSQETSAPPSSPPSTSDVITTTASQKSENCSLDSVHTPITEVTNLSTTPEVSLSTLTPRDREENSSQFTMTIDRVEEGSGASEASLVTTAAEATVYRGEVGASASPQESSSLATTAAVTNDAIVPSTTESVDGADPGETTTSEAVTSQETSAPPSSPPSTSDVITTTASQKSENCSLDSEVHTPITEVTNLSTTPEVSLSTLTPRDREENSSQFTMTTDRVEEGSGASEASLVTTAAEATVYRGEVGASVSPQEDLATTAAVTNDGIDPSTTESVDGADPGETTTSEAVASQETSSPPSSPPSTSDVITTTASQKSESCSLDSVSSCPTGWITESGEINKCYKLIETKAISWAASSLACCELSSSLLVIDSSDEVEFIEENFGSEGNVDTWLGCLESDNGLWSCTNSASTWVRDGDQSGYWHWGEGWPEEDTTGRRCVFIELSDDHDSDWKDTDCNASYRAICQKVLSPALTSKDRKG
ncbi:mucin-2-like isoform X1 [Lytechinus pictus]|uniref:mucin-2-like isoform X1 n=1 Tax=Lytechinus pictus TaxID=7653 RepID=UPI0030B9F2D9